MYPGVNKLYILQNIKHGRILKNKLEKKTWKSNLLHIFLHLQRDVLILGNQLAKAKDDKHSTTVY